MVPLPFLSVIFNTKLSQWKYSYLEAQSLPDWKITWPNIAFCPFLNANIIYYKIKCFGVQFKVLVGYTDFFYHELVKNENFDISI